VLVGAKILEVIPYLDLLNPWIVILPSEAMVTFGKLFVWVVSFQLTLEKIGYLKIFPSLPHYIPSLLEIFLLQFLLSYLFLM
jgi:hypothetical protein